MSGAWPRIGILLLATFLAFGVAIGWAQQLSHTTSSESPFAPSAESGHIDAASAHLETAGDLNWFDQVDELVGRDEQPPVDAAQVVTDSDGFPSYPLPSGNPEPLGPAVFQSGGFAAPLPRSPVWNPTGTKRVGIQVGHWFVGQLPPELQRLSAGTSAGGWSEWEANLLIGQRVVEMLRDSGVEADLLPATIPIRYRAHAFVAIHADGDTSGALHGYKLARPGFSSIPDADDELVRTMYQEYGAATGMVRDADIHISRRMTYYYAFNTRRYQHAIDLGTPAAIIETGFLTNGSDRAFLTGRPELAARGITNGILRFLDLELGARQ
jgi:N-acetylmuramoyl-L-alanine amidase